MLSPDDDAAVLAEVRRDGFVESVHRGHVAVADAAGTVLASAGRASLLCLPRSALKPTQAAAVASIVEGAGWQLDRRAWATAAASHDGSTDHQVEVARLLALADVGETALQCPVAWPADRRTAAESSQPTRLAHNCSGKHAAFLLAQRVLEHRPERYLDASGELQQSVRRAVEDASGVSIPGGCVDGCGAPAWQLPLHGVARLFAESAQVPAQTAAGRNESPFLRTSRVIADAMRAHPELVGGEVAPDTILMRSDQRVIAKRGAEGVLAAGTAAGIGVAVKIADGDVRGAVPVVATILQALDIRVPAGCVEPPVLGGGRRHGEVRVTAAVREVADQTRMAQT